MSTARASAVPIAVLSLVLAGCGAGPPPAAEPTPPAAPSAAATTSGSASASPGAEPTGPDVSGAPVPADVPRVLQQVLDARAAAILADDADAFASGLASEVGFRLVQDGYLANLGELPVSTFGYRLLPASLVRTGDGYWGVVEVSMQLGIFDTRPVTTLDRFRFVPARGGYRIASTTDAAWEAANLGVQEPWDTEPITARTGLGVLGVFDDGTASRSRSLLRSVERGVADVSARVPYDWSRQVLFYALSDPRFLDSFADVPGGDPQALDAVAFSVPAGRDDPSVASTRFALSPSLLAGLRPGADADLDRLVRHELAHVAVGTHDDRAPVWLSEGIAEWVSVQALPPQDRQVPAPALAAARDATLRMPDDASFNDDDAEIHYALAWWVCEWLAQTYGEQNVWVFLDAFTTPDDPDGPDGPGDRDDDAVVRQLLDISVDQLARRGARLMAATYDAAPAPRDPTDLPTPAGP